MNIENRIIVITGGASGIGAAMATRFVAEGARAVVIADRDLAAATRLANTLGERAQAMAVDVSQDAEVARLVDTVEADVGPIDLFCSNAGITVVGGPEVSDADWARVMNVNLMAHVFASRALLPRMLARGHGWLLNTASAAGLLSQFDATYAVSKHAAVAFAEWLSITYGDRGIGVSCLCPGGVDTPLLRNEPAARRELLSQGMISAEAVADAVVQGLADERFLILPHEFIREQMQRKAADPDRWIRGMRRFHAQVG